jgi:hypothetical protein
MKNSLSSGRSQSCYLYTYKKDDKTDCSNYKGMLLLPNTKNATMLSMYDLGKTKTDADRRKEKDKPSHVNRHNR